MTRHGADAAACHHAVLRRKAAISADPPPDFWPSAAVALLWRVRSGLGWMAYIARPSACATGRLRSTARRGRLAMGGRRRLTTVIGAPQHGH
jgi:hypothetical protein